MAYEISYDGGSMPLDDVDGTEPPFGLHIGQLLLFAGIFVLSIYKFN